MAGANLSAQAEGAARYVPEDHDLQSLANAASGCRGCGLYQDATQTVFGHGNGDAPLMLVGEQPGDREDQEGLPFVGPAGRLLARALEDANINPGSTYQTNAVKHFKFNRSGKRRIHQTPRRIEVVACQPWLLAEIEAVQPRVIVCLGATAAKSLLGNSFRITAHRGERLEWPTAITVHLEPEPSVVATLHPSALLRDRSDRRQENYEAFVEDLRRAAAILK
ncbi:uracil-DNA glycosylase [Mycobacterium intermedium]|uniref:Type-4 uracil-DNA glycosylase n=1 Tax=Mycobacterium intermedium TaxID=28445 RepID=A0A1E3SCQ6_MYCIE|nr:UdgX family uracil-DNA binding protein [Mycobacterium intermedium]MCV6966578.1 UdgX family uracil-DNA binding protein [Mycobacterium intermedium]ODQ99909.1 uracil-DNA glycosylase [Mycobacterium intermedium]OPE46563.1 uracil-DNA glycosylase [Mycobacterium intermedium]ORB08283.1 uracil-DNA glycosylase [Mycobacterium intermedium]